MANTDTSNTQSSSAVIPSAGVPFADSLERVNYFNGRFLKADDLTREQRSLLLRTALAQRAQGAGVSYGFHGARVGNAVTLAAGHAVDGYGNDLLFAGPSQAVPLADLQTRFKASPTQCTKPGPAITPTRLEGTVPTLNGAYLLTVYQTSSDREQVSVYGVQCGDNQQAACALGYHTDGVGLQLVLFDPLTGVSPDEIAMRGAGARAYFARENAAQKTRLPSMLTTLPFGAAAPLPESGGTHVPIGMAYFSGDTLIAYDEWTPKRLREPAEMGYWMSTLLGASRAARMARVLQFQAMLCDALQKPLGMVPSLWALGFADGATLRLPGVGFLPVEAPEAPTEASLQGRLDTYFAGVPYQLLPATEGEMSSLYAAALDAGELQLTKDTGGDGWHKPQLIVWYVRQNYQGFVMFTWQACCATAGKDYTDAQIAVVEQQLAQEAATRAAADQQEKGDRIKGDQDTLKAAKEYADYLLKMDNWLQPWVTIQPGQLKDWVDEIRAYKPDIDDWIKWHKDWNVKYAVDLDDWRHWRETDWKTKYQPAVDDWTSWRQTEWQGDYKTSVDSWKTWQASEWQGNYKSSVDSWKTWQTSEWNSKYKSDVDAWNTWQQNDWSNYKNEIDGLQAWKGGAEMVNLKNTVASQQAWLNSGEWQVYKARIDDAVVDLGTLDANVKLVSDKADFIATKANFAVPTVTLGKLKANIDFRGVR
jgi:hypothetical protein